MLPSPALATGSGDRTADGHAIHMEARLVDPTKFSLLSRGFNWIQERPFNR